MLPTLTLRARRGPRRGALLLRRAIECVKPDRELPEPGLPREERRDDPQRPREAGSRVPGWPERDHRIARSAQRDRHRLGPARRTSAPGGDHGDDVRPLVRSGRRVRAHGAAGRDPGVAGPSPVRARAASANSPGRRASRACPRASDWPRTWPCCAPSRLRATTSGSRCATGSWRNCSRSRLSTRSRLMQEVAAQGQVQRSGKSWLLSCASAGARNDAPFSATS